MISEEETQVCACTEERPCEKAVRRWLSESQEEMFHCYWETRGTLSPFGAGGGVLMLSREKEFSETPREE